MRLLDRTSALLLFGLLAWTNPAIAAKGGSAYSTPREPSAHRTTVKLSESERRKTADQAKQEALDKAQRYVAVWLLQIKPDARWEPSLDFLKRNGIVRDPQADSGEFVAHVGENLYGASVDVEITATAQTLMLREARMAEAWERQLGFGKVFLGIAVLLAAVAGYFWLDDVSKGYYTNWLRVGVVGFLAAAGWLIVKLPNLREVFVGG